MSNTIWERYWKIKQDRRNRQMELIKEYDENFYYPALKSLQEECGKMGHTNGKLRMSGHKVWRECDNCGKAHSIYEIYDDCDD